MNEKKEYAKPSVTSYGSVAEITRSADSPGSDGQGSNSSYSPGDPGFDSKT